MSFERKYCHRLRSPPNSSKQRFLPQNWSIFFGPPLEAERHGQRVGGSFGVLFAGPTRLEE